MKPTTSQAPAVPPLAVNLFESLQQVRRLRRRVVLQPGQKTDIQDPATGRIVTQTHPMVGAEPIIFEIQNVTANEIIEADGMITAQPPKVFQEQPSPSRIGTVQAHVGYDYDDPEYIAKRNQQSYKREACVCLHGCPDLMTTTPGATVADKVEKLVAALPAALLGWLAEQIDTLSLITAVGEEEVESFLAAGSGTSSSSGSSRKASPASGRSKSSKSSTAATSTTKLGKRRTTGG
jgi:hypothetical protein